VEKLVSPPWEEVVNTITIDTDRYRRHITYRVRVIDFDHAIWGKNKNGHNTYMDTYICKHTTIKTCNIYRQNVDWFMALYSMYKTLTLRNSGTNLLHILKGILPETLLNTVLHQSGYPCVCIDGACTECIFNYETIGPKEYLMAQNNPSICG
jgi:hypothetical protein